MKISSELYIFQEEESWIVAFARVHDNMCETAKIVFDFEPDDEEIYNFIVSKYNEIEFKVLNSLE